MRIRNVVALLTMLVLVGMVQPLHARDTELFKLKPGANGPLCLKCHAAFQEKMSRAFVHTPLKKGECSGCHNPHTSNHGKMLAADPKSVCGACHKPVIDKGAVSIHKVVAEGGCIKCHDPHAAPYKGNLLVGGNQLCFTCHKQLGEAVTKAKYRHAPVDKGCLSCHLPHSSVKGPFLLKADINPLCTGCHQTDKPLFVKKHMNYPVASARCTGCHDPHGSEVPGLLHKNVHAPVAKRMCNQCHEEATSSTPLKTRRDGMELCRGCHNDMFNQTFGKNRMHWPVTSKEGCLSCHNPHASAFKGLLRQPTAQLCGKCHQDTMKRQTKNVSKHEPVVEGRCTECHDPHSSNSLFLTKQNYDFDLCVTCHDWGKHSSHPIGEKVRDPRNKNLSLGCNSCHRSHGTEFKKMLFAPTTTEMCIQCHEQMRR